MFTFLPLDTYLSLFQWEEPHLQCKYMSFTMEDPELSTMSWTWNHLHKFKLYVYSLTPSLAGCHYGFKKLVSQEQQPVIYPTVPPIFVMFDLSERFRF